MICGVGSRVDLTVEQAALQKPKRQQYHFHSAKAKIGPAKTKKAAIPLPFLCTVVKQVQPVS